MRVVLIGLLLISILLVPYASADLVSYWSFNNVSDPGKDYSGGNDGTVYGVAWKADGFKNGAISFDGINDYINCGNDSTLNMGTGDFTLSAWIKISDPDNDYYSIIGKTGAGNTLAYRLFLGNTNGYPYVRIANDTDWIHDSYPFYLRDGEWHFVAGTVNRSGRLYVYVDGNTDLGIDISSFTGTIGTTNSLHIGADPYWFGTNFFNGTIDEVRIYNYALSAEEILERYNEEKEVYDKADLNQDGVVDIYDMAIVSIHFGQKQSYTEWNSTADVILDDEIDIFDVVFIASRFSEETTTCTYTCKDNPCNSYDDCNPEEGECTSGYCCSGTCAPPPPPCPGTCMPSPCTSYDDCTTASGTCSSGYCCTGTCTPPTNGSVVYAASCDFADVQTALDAASDGDILSIPAGTCTWNYSIKTNKAVHFKGAGQDFTIIQLDVNTWQDQGSLFRWQANSATAYNPKWSDMTLNVLNGPVGKIGIRINYGARDFMIWNCTFNNWGFAGVAVMGYDGDSPDLPNWDNSGVIFDCIFNDCWMQGYGYGVYVSGEDDEAWADGMELGTFQAVFIEDNYFTGSRHSIASGAGSRYVARYNHLYGQEFNTEHIIDAHGWTGIFDGEHMEGSLQYEIYGNEIEGNALGKPVGIKIRGGNGVIFNNTFYNMYNQFTIFLDHDNRGHCINEETYPCKDQITDLYIWGNTNDGAAITSDDVHVYDYVAYDLTNYIVENRDWFMHERPDYTPYPYPHPLRHGV